MGTFVDDYRAQAIVGLLALFLIAAGTPDEPPNPPPPQVLSSASAAPSASPTGDAEPAAVDATRPLFLLPFECGDEWDAGTYPGHGGNGFALDLNHTNLAYEKGAPVYASADGVASVWYNGALGHHVWIDHGSGWRTLYAHLIEKPSIPDLRVERGDEIGNVGGTPDYPVHLHYLQEYKGETKRAVIDGKEVPYGPEMYWTGPPSPKDPYPNAPVDPYDLVSTNRCEPASEDEPVDVFMIVDTSGSFSDDLAGFQASAVDIVAELTAANDNTRFGLATFEDYPINPFGGESSGDQAYRRELDLTFDTNAFVDAVNGLFVRWGNDGPESQLAAIYQAASGAGQDLSALGYPDASIGAGQNASFRNGAQKIIMLWTDASFHLPGDEGDIPYPGPTLEEAAAAVLALDPPKVVGISAGSDAGDLELLAAATNTVAGVDGVDCDDDGDIDVAPGDPIVCPTAAGGAGLSAAIEATVASIGQLPYWWAGSGIGAERFADRVELSWPEAVDDGPIATYRVYRDGVLVASTAAPTASVSGLDASTTYQFSVQAIDGAGNVTTDGPTVSLTTAASFRDVANDHVFADDIEWLAGEGITRGCNPPVNDLYCPDGLVTREQMAAFLGRAVGFAELHLGGLGTIDFTDDDGSIFEANIEYLAGVGITRGCNPPVNDRYCPTDFVTRGQMAAFLVRALGLTDAGGGNTFVDDNGSVFEQDIAKLATAGVTKGCNPPVNDRFCPDGLVTRGQMAAFLRRALSG